MERGKWKRSLQSTVSAVAVGEEIEACVSKMTVWKHWKSLMIETSSRIKREGRQKAFHSRLSLFFASRTVASMNRL